MLASYQTFLEYSPQANEVRPGIGSKLLEEGPINEVLHNHALFFKLEVMRTL